MKVLAYLLGSRALDAARQQENADRRAVDEGLPPLATTAETASAWRRWSQQREETGVPADHWSSKRSAAPDRRPTSA